MLQNGTFGLIDVPRSATTCMLPGALGDQGADSTDWPVCMFLGLPVAQRNIQKKNIFLVTTWFIFWSASWRLYHIRHFFVSPRRLLSPTPLPPRLRLTAAGLKETVIDGAKRALPDSLRGAVRSPAWISLTKSVLLA